MLDLAINFAVALFIGALVGIEREKKKSEEDAGTAFGGIRTFILFALSGAVSAWLSVQLKTPWIFVAAFLIIAALIACGYILQNRKDQSSLGLTSETAGIIVFLLGGTALFGFKEIAVALGIATSVALAYKQPLHGFVGKLGEDDIYAGLKLLVATFIVLPVLPDREIDPWKAINPYKMWLLVILISGLSLVGYVATRWFGTRRGTSMTGLFGGLVSSTAVTLSFARQSRQAKDSPKWINGLAAGLLIAWCVMFIRILIEIAIVNLQLLRPILIPMLTMAAISGIISFLFYRWASGEHAKRGTHEVQLQNPFSLISALKFALLFGIVMLIVKYVQQNFASQGFYVVAALAGLTDVDAITLSMAGYAKSGGDLETAVTSITIAAVTNTVVKCCFVFVLAEGKIKTLIGIATILILAGGATALIFV